MGKEIRNIRKETKVRTSHIGIRIRHDEGWKEEKRTVGGTTGLYARV
jgi:hypothetical protein